MDAGALKHLRRSRCLCYTCGTFYLYTEHRELLQSSLVADAGDVCAPAGISRSDAVSSGDAETSTVNHGPSTGAVSSSSAADAGSLSTLAMIILSYNKNDARLAIDNVRQGTFGFRC